MHGVITANKILVMCLLCQLIWNWCVLHERNTFSSAAIYIVIHAPYFCQKECTSGYEGLKKHSQLNATM